MVAPLGRERREGRGRSRWPRRRRGRGGRGGAGLDGYSLLDGPAAMERAGDGGEPLLVEPLPPPKEGGNTTAPVEEEGATTADIVPCSEGGRSRHRRR
jgi:hypothetical protein